MRLSVLDQSSCVNSDEDRMKSRELLAAGFGLSGASQRKVG